MVFSANEQLGLLKNMIIPGWGFQDLDNQKHQSKKYYPVTEIFYSDLWNKNCQFFLDINYKKYELIYEN